MNLNFTEKHDHKLNYREKLDLALEALRNNNGEYLHNGLFVALNARYAANITEQEYKRVIEKLNKDGFLTIIKSDNYSITLDGYYFIGYEIQHKVDEEKIKIISKNESRKESRENSLKNATWFAGFAALLLFLFQIYSYCHPAPIPITVKLKLEKKP